MIPGTASQGQIYYKGGGQWRLRNFSNAQHSGLDARRSSYGDLSSSGSGNFQGDCGGGFRYSSNEDLFSSQVKLSVRSGQQTPTGTGAFFSGPNPLAPNVEAFDLKAATEQLIDRTQQLQGSARNTPNMSNNRRKHTRVQFGEWVL